MTKTKSKAKENIGVQQAIDKIKTDVFKNLIPEQDQRHIIIGKTLELLANGCPALPDEIAKLFQVSPDKVLSTLHGFGAEFDKEGNVVGLGLSLVPTPHAYETNNRKLYT